MLSIQMNSQRDATRMLFLQPEFDFFHLTEASFACAVDFHVDGHFNREFFEDGENETTETEVPFVFWEQVRAVCFQMIKGKRLPVSFQIAFYLSKEEAAEHFHAPALCENADISGYMFVIRYKNQTLTATSGVSFHRFSMDKDSEKLWDQILTRFLDEQNLSYTEL